MTYGLTGEQLTPWVDTSAYGLRKAWNAVKGEVAPWWAENSKEAYASGCANLAAALGNRKAGRTRMPRFTSKHRSRPSCRFTGAVGLGTDRRHIRLPVIGAVRTHESIRKLARKMEAGVARIRSATLSWQRGRWHDRVAVEVPDPTPPARTGGRLVGVDLGITDLAVLSTGEHVPNPRCLDGRLRRAQRVCARRRAPDRRTGTDGSNRWRKARRRADRIHTQIAAQRRDHLHKLTTRLVAEFDVIGIEDLAVANMMRNRRLARHIAGASWAELHRQLECKSAPAGVRLVVVNRWMPSSKTCSGCGAVRTKLALSERTYECTTCGLVLDRDHNAARNLAALAADTGESRRELLDGSDVRPVVLARPATASPREESTTTHRHHREAVAR